MQMFATGAIKDLPTLGEASSRHRPHPHHVAEITATRNVDEVLGRRPGQPDLQLATNRIPGRSGHEISVSRFDSTRLVTLTETKRSSLICLL